MDLYDLDGRAWIVEKVIVVESKHNTYNQEAEECMDRCIAGVYDIPKQG